MWVSAVAARTGEVGSVAAGVMPTAMLVDMAVIAVDEDMRLMRVVMDLVVRDLAVGSVLGDIGVKAEMYQTRLP